MTDWRDQLAGARMRVDQQFQERVTESRFSNQQWGLIMTAVEWDVRRPEDPREAQLVADTSNLPDIVPELDRVQEQLAGAARPTADEGGGGITARLESLFGGFFGSSNAGSDHEAQLADAEALVQEYARELQGYLESQNRWEEIRTAAAGSEAETDS